MLYFNSLTDFFAMGGHGFYIWISYAIVLGALVIQTLTARSALNRTMKNIVKYYRRAETRRAKQHPNKVI